MATLTRYTPFDEGFEDLLKGFFVRPMSFEGQTPVQMRIDVKEEESAYVVHAEIPGVKKEDINVTIDGDQIAISAEVKRNREEKQGDKVLHSERLYGKVYRAFTLPQDIDEASAQAKYNDGVLELRLPRKSASSAKKLSIQ